MAQADYIVANGTGAAVRSDLNGQLAAIVSNNSGATEPATMYAYQWWADTTTGLLKLRNSANSAWISLRELDGTLLMEDGTAAAPGLSFASDLDTGFFSAGANAIGIATNGVERVEFGTSEVVFNDGGANYDFRIEGDTNTSLFFVDASAEAVGIGTASPGAKLHVNPGSGNKGDIYLDYGTGSTADGRLVIEAGASAVLYETIKTGGLPQAWYVTGSERMRIDSGGRLLVGTSSSPSLTDGQYSKLHVIGNTNSASGDGIINIGRGALASSGLVNGTSLGNLQFTDSAGAVHAVIGGQADGTTGTNDYPGRLTFSTTADGASSPAERMRIDNGGQHRMFSLSSSYSLVIGNGSAAGQSYLFLEGRHSATDNSGDTGTRSFVVWTSGNVINTNNSYGGISDVKLKENIVDATSQWSDIKALQVRKYNFKEGQTHTQIGLVAQEAELVSPGLVSESPDRDDEGNDLGTVTKSVNYSVLYMKAVKALQEAMDRIEALEARLTAAGIE
jgi:hypothetical protein